jgi:hypothetical protein
MTIDIYERATSFAEDKDVAASIREREIRPTLSTGDSIVLDFSRVEGATQSFIHAMLSDLIRTMGAVVLDRIEFKSCNDTIQPIIEIVVQYSQLDPDD